MIKINDWEKLIKNHIMSECKLHDITRGEIAASLLYRDSFNNNNSHIGEILLSLAVAIFEETEEAIDNLMLTARAEIIEMYRKEMEILIDDAERFWKEERAIINPNDEYDSNNPYHRGE